MILPGFPRPLPMKGGFDPNTPIGTFIEGGYYAGTVTYGGNSWALIVAPKLGGETNNIQWKTANNGTAGTDDADDGWANTNAMANATHPAADFCRSLVLNEKDDWYLPALNETLVLWNSQNSLPSGQEITSGTGTRYIWSSTQASSSTAWRRDFSNGTQFNGGSKTNSGPTNYARAIRRVEI